MMAELRGYQYVSFDYMTLAVIVQTVTITIGYA